MFEADENVAQRPTTVLELGIPSVVTATSEPSQQPDSNHQGCDVKAEVQQHNNSNSDQDSIVDLSSDATQPKFESKTLYDARTSTGVSVRLEAVRHAARPKQSGFSMHVVHFRALFIKRLSYARRDVKALCYQLLIPVIMVAVGLAIVKAAIPTDYPSMQLTTGMLNANTGPTSSGKFELFTQTGPNRVPWANFKASAGARPTSSDVSSLILGLPQGNATTLNFDLSASQLDGVLDPYGLVKAGAQQPQLTWQQMSAHLLNTKDAEATKESVYMTYAWTRDNTLFPNQDPSLLSDNVYTYSSLINTTWVHAAPTVVNLANSAVLQRASGNSKANIVTRTFPLPYTLRQGNLLGSFFSSAVS